MVATLNIQPGTNLAKNSGNQRSRPEKAMMPLPPEDALQYKKDQVRAFEATTPPMRRMMDRMLKLIEAAE